MFLAGSEQGSTFVCGCLFCVQSNISNTRILGGVPCRHWREPGCRFTHSELQR